MTSAVAPKRARRGWLPWVAILGGLVVVGLVIGAPSHSSSGLDPRGTAKVDTKALVLLLRDSGAAVAITSRVPDANTDVAVLLQDTTSQAMTDQLTSWVRAGGVLVVADPGSSFVPLGGGTALFGLPGPVTRGQCDIAALGGVDTVRPPDGAGFFRVPNGSGRCFADRAGAFVVDTPTGDGHIVGVGGASVFTNGALGDVDNAVLAVALMAPRHGTRVAYLYGMTPGVDAGGPSLTDLISLGAKLGALQLIVAFGVFVWWQARRLGRPVVEAQPVQIAGSELVSAHGHLLQQTHDPDRAARAMRNDLRRRLCERLGLARDATPDLIADVTSRRTGLARERVAAAVSDVPVRSDEELLELSRSIDAIRTEVLHGSAP